MGTIALILAQAMRAVTGQIGWISLFGLGGAFVALTTGLVVGADWLTGGTHTPSRQFVERLVNSNRISMVFGKVPFLGAR
jgi:hypothetical protein